MMTQERRDELMAKSMRQMREARAEHRAAAIAGHEAIKRLVIACGHKSGQSRTVRAALYSLWNGGARSLRESVTGIDWSIKKDLCAVMLGFGFDGNEAVPSLWDDAIRKPFEAAGLWGWFLEEAELNEEEPES